MKSGIMKLLVVFAGLLWMSLLTEGIPIDVARKNQPKTLGLSDIINISQGQVAPSPSEPINDDNKIDDETFPEVKSEKKDDGTQNLNNVPKKIKTGLKNKLDKTLSNTSNGLRNKLKTSTRKIKAKINHFESDDVLPKRNKTAPRKIQNRTIDLSDIDDVLPDKLKKKYGEYVKQGRGKNVEELANIRKKMRILKKITGSKNTDATDKTVASTSDIDDLAFDGDEELDEVQLDSIIASTARHYGVDMEPLKKYGIKNNRPKRQSWVAPDADPVDRLWPKTTSIKYWYDTNVTTRTQNIIKKALANIENQTCLTFTSSKSATPRLQYVNWSVNNRCSSPVGLNPTTNGNGIHQIKIGSCNTNYGTISHETLHVLGIKHQQIRSDRDDYLINAGGSEAILDEFNSNNFGSPYDYGSVMHYSSFKAEQSIYQQTLGHRVGPSFTDIAVLNQRYNCFCKNPTVTCLNGGYPNPWDCDTCLCPHGYGGRTCTGIDPGTEDESEIISDLTDECKTFKKSLGTQDDEEYDFYSKAWVQFKAPAGKKVQLIFVNAADGEQTDSNGCDDNGIELKITKARFNETGMVFCGNNEMLISESNDDIKTFTSSGNMAMLQLFTKKNKIDVELRYRLVDSADDDDVPSSCFPVLDEDPNCQNIKPDSSCEGWNNNPAEDCEADEEWMAENCAKTCGVC